MHLTINDKVIQVEVDPEMPLLWVLRDELNLTGTKYGCGIGHCGACTVLVNGKAKRSCVLPVANSQNKNIITIEHLENVALIQKAWITEQVPQCGYCQSGMITAAYALLEKYPLPTDDQIDQFITNICRCGTYPRIRNAIKVAAQLRSTTAIQKLPENQKL